MDLSPGTTLSHYRIVSAIGRGGMGEVISVPTFVGSGITAENIMKFSKAGGLIVGSSIKQDGHWANPIDLERTRAVVRAFNA
jgi:predicted TIM-barrel enzyme